MCSPRPLAGAVRIQGAVTAAVIWWDLGSESCPPSRAGVRPQAVPLRARERCFQETLTIWKGREVVRWESSDGGNK